MKYTHTDVLDIILDILQLYKLYTSRGEVVDLQPVISRLDEILRELQAKGSIGEVTARLDQLIQEIRGLQVRVPAMVETKGWLEEAEAYYRDGEGTASTGIIYEEVLPYKVRITSFLVNISGGGIQLRKNSIPIFPSDALITTSGTWISINPPSKIAVFEPGSKLQIYINGDNINYKWIIVGVKIKI